MNLKLKRINLLFICLISIGSLSYAGSSTISNKLLRLVNNLTAQYSDRSSLSAKPALAVFPLNCSADLTKRRIGFGVSELLTHQFVSVSQFIVVERTELAKISNEQKLQHTGTIDSDTAVKVGKLTGANLILLGSVEKYGRNYQVNVRLINVETGEIEATGYEELSSHLFEEEAKPYLVLVPEKQSIGFYFLYNYMPIDKKSTTITDQYYNWQRTTKLKLSEFTMVGAGIKYQPSVHIVLDVAYMAISEKFDVATITSGNVNFPASYASYTHEFGDTFAFRGMVGWKKSFFPYLKSQLSLGIIRYHLYIDSKYGDIDENFPVSSPLVNLNVEFYPQQRIGIGLNINYVFKELKGTLSNLNNAEYFKLNQFSLEPTITIYF